MTAAVTVDGKTVAEYYKDIRATSLKDEICLSTHQITAHVMINRANQKRGSVTDRFRGYYDHKAEHGTVKHLNPIKYTMEKIMAKTTIEHNLEKGLIVVPKYYHETIMAAVMTIYDEQPTTVKSIFDMFSRLCIGTLTSHGVRQQITKLCGMGIFSLVTADGSDYVKRRGGKRGAGAFHIKVRELPENGLAYDDIIVSFEEKLKSVKREEARPKPEVEVETKPLVEGEEKQEGKELEADIGIVTNMIGGLLGESAARALKGILKRGKIELHLHFHNK